MRTLSNQSVIYDTPLVQLFEIEPEYILCQSTTEGTSEDDEDDSITVNLDEYNWTPDEGERVLVAHQNCKIMKHGGKYIGTFLGKERYVTEEASPQNFICCVTDQRMILIPQDIKKNIKAALTVMSSFSGATPFIKKLVINSVLNEYVDYPIVFPRENVIKSEISLDFPDGTLLIIQNKGYNLYLGFSDLSHSLDTSTAITQPELFI